MSFWEIGYTAEAILSQLNKKCYKYYTEEDIEILLYNAVKNGKLNRNEIAGNKKLIASLIKMEVTYGKLP
jgi:hypothetical protein